MIESKIDPWPVQALEATLGLPIPRIFFIDRDGKVIGQMQAEEDLPRFLKQLAANKA